MTEQFDDGVSKEDDGNVRKFSSGATRDTAEGKLDFEGFLCPLVLERYAEYMNKNRLQSDGKLRDSDNWQKGIPKGQYMKSVWRHFFAVWSSWRAKHKAVSEDDLCALMFNTMGMLHEIRKEVVNEETEKRGLSADSTFGHDVSVGHQFDELCDCEDCQARRNAG